MKLWEISTSRVLITYTGAGMEKQNHRTQAVFNHTEDYGKYKYYTAKSFLQQSLFSIFNAKSSTIFHLCYNKAS